MEKILYRPGSLVKRGFLKPNNGRFSIREFWVNIDMQLMGRYNKSLGDTMKRCFLISILFFCVIINVIAFQYFDPKAPSSVAFSPDGKYLAVGTKGGDIRIIDAVTMDEIKIFFHISQSFIRSVLFSPDGKHLVSCANTIVLFDFEAGMKLFELEHGYTVTSIAFSPDGKKLVSGSTDNTIKIWDILNNGEILTINGLNEMPQKVSFSPDGSKIFSSLERRVTIWNADTGEEVQTFSRQNWYTHSAAFSNDDKRIAICFYNHASGTIDFGKSEIYIYNAQNYNLVSSFKMGKGAIKNIIFDYSDKYIFIDFDGDTIAPDPLKIIILNSINGKIIDVIVHGNGLTLAKNTFSLSYDGKYIAGTGKDGRDVEKWLLQIE